MQETIRPWEGTIKLAYNQSISTSCNIQKVFPVLMSNYRIWPILVLVIAVLIYFWGGDDQQEPDQSAQQVDQQAVSPPPSRQSEPRNPPAWDASGGYQPPVDIYGNYSSGYTTSDRYSNSQYSYPDGLGFRPSGDKTVSQYQYTPSYAPPQSQGYSTTTPDPTFQNQPGYGVLQQPESNYQFRPLNKNKKVKRWSGNYGQMKRNPSQPSSPYPYPYDGYPVPSYPPQSPEPNPLWANSWPDR